MVHQVRAPGAAGAAGDFPVPRLALRGVACRLHRPAHRASASRLRARKGLRRRRYRSKPLSAALSFRVFQGAFFLIGAFFLYMVVDSVAAGQSGGAFLAAGLRFRVLALRGGGTPNATAAPGWADFGLLSGGCTVPLPPDAVLTAAGTLLWGPEVAADGYYFVTGSGDAMLDPIQWEVQAAVAGEWSNVGASGWRTDATGWPEFLPGLRFDTPLARGQRVDVDLRPPWPSLVKSWLSSALWVAGLFCSVAVGVMGRQWAVRPVLVLTCLLSLSLTIICAAGFAAVGDSRSATSSALWVVSSTLLLVGLARFEAQIVAIFVAFALTYYVASLATDLAIYSPAIGLSAALYNLLPTPASATLLFALVIIVFRRRTLARARRLVLIDRSRYDALWADLAASPDAQRGLLAVRDHVRDLTTGLAPEAPRQYNRERQPEETVPSVVGPSGAPVRLRGPTGPVDSLEQLFAQARATTPLREYALICLFGASPAPPMSKSRRGDCAGLAGGMPAAPPLGKGAGLGPRQRWLLRRQGLAAVSALRRRGGWRGGAGAQVRRGQVGESRHREGGAGLRAGEEAAPAACTEMAQTGASASALPSWTRPW